MILESPAIDPDLLESRTGWSIKPEGACKGVHCVPLPDARHQGGLLEAEVVADRLGMPLVVDEEHGLWALGPETAITGRALTAAKAPDLVLPDRDGNPLHLSSLHGKKVLLVAWASW
jgi:hypothetical protein